MRDSLVDVVGAAHVEDVDAATWRALPGSPAEVAELVRVCAAHRACVVPVGSGSRIAPPTTGRPRVLVSMRRLDHVVHLDETSLVAHVQAGVTGNELEHVLAPRGLSIGDYPPVVLASTLGGIIAVRTPGKSSARHGFFEDAVLGVSAVLADGRTVHTRVAPRRASGPDLARALCGSEGTIGLITSVALRLHRRPEARYVAAYILPSVGAAVSAVYLALREEAQPSGARIYGPDEARAHFEREQIALALAAGEALLVVGTAGPTDLAACDRDLFTSAVTAEGGRTFDPAVAELWWKRLHGGAPTPVPPPTLQVLSRPGKVSAVYQAMRDAANAAGGATRAHVSRFDADGALIFATLLRGRDVIAAPAEAGTDDVRERRSSSFADDPVRRAVLAAAESAGGWLLGARAQRLDPYLSALRAALDPHAIMNPDALTGSHTVPVT
jgi:alkyldihydroxyacetonephosphate synthase